MFLAADEAPDAEMVVETTGDSGRLCDASRCWVGAMTSESCVWLSPSDGTKPGALKSAELPSPPAILLIPFVESE